MSDIWCRKHTMPDGTVVYGCAAREARIKAKGGVEKLLKDVAAQAAMNAANSAFQLGMRTAHSAPANGNAKPTVRRLRRSA